MKKKFEIFTRKFLSLLIICSLVLSVPASLVRARQVSDEIINPLSALTGSPTMEKLAGFQDFSDPALLRYIENSAYLNLVEALDSEEYFVEDIQAIYISDEYIKELAYNSKENVFFGYTISELARMLGDAKYVFTLGENGRTVVKEFENYDDTFEKVLTDVAIGSGVILICATVSFVTGGVAPAASVILAASAKTGAVYAISSGLTSAVTTGALTAIQTGAIDQALKAAAVSGGQQFKWGAITGNLIGGAQSFMGLRKGIQSGLTLNQVAKIQRESNYPVEVIRRIKSMDEYEGYYKELGLKPRIFNGRFFLVPDDLDLEYIGPGKTQTNLERMLDGHPPIDPRTKESYELHHLRHDPNGPLAVMPWDVHRKNFWRFHDEDAAPVNHGREWEKQRSAFWKEFAKFLLENMK